MTTIHVLSPHFDDACISLGLSMSVWQQAGYDIHLVNCFTQSDHAPFAAVSGREAVSRLRASEDGAFCRAAGIRSVTNLDLLDAPLRGWTSGSLFAPPGAIPEPAQVRRLGTLLPPLVASGLLVAPLAIGRHVDHILAREAAVRLQNVGLGFYEDLPYAGAITAGERTAAAARLALETGRTLTPAVYTAADAIERKCQLLSAYASQFTPDQVASVRHVMQEYGGGERLWLDPACMTVLRGTAATARADCRP